MSKIISAKRNTAIFLAIVLFAGTIATISPSFMTATAQAEPYFGMDNRYDSYEAEYTHRNNYEPTEYPCYKPEYPSDNNYKSKDGNSSVNVKKVKCNNINVNVNGLELNLTSVPFLSNLLASEAHADEGERGASSYGSGQSGSEINDFKFICINNNNTVAVGEEPPTPIPPVEECAAVEDIEACFANAEFMSEGIGFPEFVAALESGITIEINGQDITLGSFNDICLAFEGLTTYDQLVDDVSQIEIDTGAEFGEGFFAVVNCIAESIGISIPPDNI